MPTDQRRFEVFVSSTYSDLREARQRVTMSLLECDAFPTGMEIFPATDDDAWTLIRRIIDECDYYLLVIAGRYGSVDPTSGLSYTEMEYDYAVSVGKPVMAFLHSDLRELKSGLCENTQEGRTKLQNFREKVKKAKHVKFWKSPEELAGQVALTYNKFVRFYPATGWVRADQATPRESLKELLDAKSRIEQLEGALRKVEISAPPGSEDLAQGTDEFDVPCRLDGRYTNKRGIHGKVACWVTSRVSWDIMFAAIAPQLLQDAGESALRRYIQNFLNGRFVEENLAALAAEAMEDRKVIVTPDDLSQVNLALASETFGTILVQLGALGLIQKSDRKRSVSDTGSYWKLTPYGERRTVQLRAIKKGQLGPPIFDDAAADETVGDDT